MNNEQQDSGNFISSSKLSATVPAFVPGIAHPGTDRFSSDLVIKSTLSPLVPEFHPSGSFTPPLSTSYQPIHGLHYHAKRVYFKHEKIHLYENAPHEAYQTTFPLSKHIIAAKTKKPATTRKGNKDREAQNGPESTTSEHSAEISVNVGNKKRQRKKKESSDVIKQQDNEELRNKSSIESQRVSSQLKAKGLPTSSQPNCAPSSFSSDTSPENTRDNRTNETVISNDQQPDKTEFPSPNFPVSYSDKVKSLSLKNNGTSNRSVTEKCWVKDFALESSSKTEKASDVKQSLKVHLGQTTRAFNLDNNIKTAAKSGHSGDTLKYPPDSTCNTAWEDSEYYKLKYGDSLKSQTTRSKQIPRTRKQMERNRSFKKMSCDDDENWRVKKEDVHVLDSSTSHKTDSLKKMNIKNLNTESSKKRTYQQEGIHVNSRRYEKDVIKQEKSVAPIVVEDDAKTSRKQQNSCHLGSSSTEAAHLGSPVNKLGSVFPSSSQEHKINQMPNASVVASLDNKIMEGEFPDLKESVKMKRLSTTEGKTFDYKVTVTSTKPSPPTCMSYSAVLRSTPQPKPVVVSPAWENEQATTRGGLLKVASQAVASEAEIEAGRAEPTPKKKKKKKKKKKTGETGEQTQETGSAKRTQKPIQFDLGVMLQTISKSSQERTQQSGKKLVVASGVLPTQLPPTSPTDVKPGVKNAQKDENKIPHNKLDSTAPVIKRGKERETPARKKPSALKKIILKEREEKKKARETIETEDVAETCDDKENRTCESDGENTVHEEVQSQSEDEATEPEPLSPTDQEIAAEIHSRRFREYCFQIPDKDVDTVASELLRELVRFQDRQFHKDPVKAKAKRRFVLGLREVNKHLKLRKLKCVIISSNVERIKSAGGLDDTLSSIINLCQENHVPVVFALKRHLLGKVLLKKVPVSIVGIFNYDGAQDHFKTLIELTQKTRQAYTERWQETREKLESQQKETSDTKNSGMEMVSCADVKQVDDITQTVGGEAGTASNLADDTESGDNDDDGGGKEEESDNDIDRYSEKENIVIENDLEIQDI